jgi:hypothetical protein
MAGRVIQGFFLGGGFRQPTSFGLAAPRLRPVRGTVQPRLAPGTAGALHKRPMPGPPPALHQGRGPVAQPHGGNGSFDIDPARIGLARSGGRPLPAPVLAKMETAFNADFSAVRVHVGPQASRIGALAFTTGNDLYFAQGQYQPDSVRGQQLIGHELAHVIQQRQGRVRASGAGLAVVQDRALEAEADRLGMRAATTVQRKAAPGGTRPGSAGFAPVRPAGPPARIGPPHVIQRSKGISGGKGGLGYGDGGRDFEDDEELQEALDRAGLKGVKGHGKGGSGSGESGQTKVENAKLMDAKREIREEKYLASRPKAVIKHAPPMDQGEKLLTKLAAIKKTQDAVHMRKQDLREYLSNRNVPASPTEQDKMIDWLEDESTDLDYTAWAAENADNYV